MFKFPTEMEGRYCNLLLQNIPAAEIKVTKVSDDEIVGIYSDGEEIHINPAMLVAYWPDPKRDNAAKSYAKAVAKRAKIKEVTEG
jgi:hypothetical protein